MDRHLNIKVCWDLTSKDHNLSMLQLIFSEEVSNGGRFDYHTVSLYKKEKLENLKVIFVVLWSVLSLVSESVLGC